MMETRVRPTHDRSSAHPARACGTAAEPTADRAPRLSMEVPVVDPVSEVLRTVRLTGAFFYMGEGGGPWSVGTVAARELTPRILPDAAHLISFHVLLVGECWAGGDGL